MAGSPHEGPRRPRSVPWKLWKVVFLGAAVALLLGAALGQTFAWWVAGEGSWWSAWTELNSDQLLDVLRSAVVAVAIVAAGGVTLIAYRGQRTAEDRQRTAAARQWTAESRHQLERERHALAEGGELRGRYVSAAEQLGHVQAAVRLAGVYAMAGLADEWSRRGDPAEQQVCVDVLCAYLRMPAGQGAGKQEAEVRSTVVRVLRQHLLSPASSSSWCRADIDLTGADLWSADFSGATFSGERTTFDGATFAGRTDFGGAAFSGQRASFDGATFSGKLASFDGATFSAAHTGFGGAAFSGGITSFHRATFSGGTAHFDRATFSAAHTSFGGATFSGGMTSFGGATFGGEVASFDRATFSGGMASFAGAAFSGGEVSFDRATFRGGRTSFNEATFSGEQVRFRDARVVGSTVDLSVSAWWSSTVEGAVPDGIRLPAEATGTSDRSGSDTRGDVDRVDRRHRRREDGGRPISQRPGPAEESA
ncbi:pentapeptide repeat-containing protein [Geodermatophilus sp. SYSU D00758]